jgi:CheY-like chemotaxis protein
VIREASDRHGPVLVVDDHPVNRLLLEQVLELEQVDVLAASSIAEAERVLKQTLPSVIVLDLQLPDGYGLDLARRLKADPHTSGCAIVACTAGRVRDEEALAHEAGCDRYVTKPIDTREFARLVCSLIGRPELTPAVSAPWPLGRSGASRPASARAERP